jgi:hypothetical protein
MVGHITISFSGAARSNPHFKPIEPSTGPEPIAPRTGWRQQYWRAVRIDPEPTDLRSFQADYPDLAHVGLPDLLTIASVPVVSEAFRQLVHSLEPNQHQFVPILLFDELRQPLAGTYWIMNILIHSECIVEPAQIMKWHAEGHAFPELENCWRANRDGSRRLTRRVTYVDRAQVQGRHLCRPLWRQDQHLYQLELLFSDELVQQIASAKLQKLTVHPAVEVSVPSHR